ncbi:MAG: response regulator [Anaerolineae bacterium]
MTSPMPRETFLEHLREALGHLYHADHLQQSPLIPLFGLEDRFDRAAALRQILLDGIEALRPDSQEQDAFSRNWRTYESLFCCYVQQLTQQIAADQLAISPRQLRREQRLAIEILADHLWQEHVRPRIAETKRAPRPADAKDVLEEMPWVQEIRTPGDTRLQEYATEVIQLTANLAAKHGVRVSANVPSTLPSVAMHPVFAKQAMLSLVDIGIQQAAGGKLEVAAQQDGASVSVSIHAHPHAAPPELSPSAQRNLEIVHQIVLACGGHLSVHSEPPSPLRVELVLPVLKSVPILIVDDNEDALQLYARYAAGTRYRLITTPHPSDIGHLVRRHAPRAILLDIMMPQGNGWTVLGALRQDPLTRGIPIIVCTILPQEELALSLGAHAFVLKPVSREQFLAALDGLDGRAEPGSG